MPVIRTAPETYPNTDPTPIRGLWKDPRALDRSWVAPTLVGREDLLARLETSVLSGLTHGGRVAVSLSGPCGAGTSAVAARLIKRATGRLVRPGAKGVPLVLRADASGLRTPSALVTALWRGIDPDFSGKGSSSEFLSLLLLRRIRTVGRPTIIWVDQVPARTGELGRVLGALAQPSRTLPEGPEGLPTALLVTSGGSDSFPEGVEALRTALPPLLGEDLRQAIMVRANAALAASPAPSAIAAIADLSIARGWGLSMVGELLAGAGRRAEARGGHWLEAEDIALPARLPKGPSDAAGFEEIVIEALRALEGATAVSHLRAVLVESCTAKGASAPTTARLWRHLVRLERTGLLRREVRIGGRGGSKTLVSLATWYR